MVTKTQPSARGNHRVKALSVAMLLVVSVFIGLIPTRAQDSAQVVEIFLQGSRSIQLAGATRVQVLDESICRAELSPDTVQFFGLLRGETVAFVWIGERRINLLARVVPAPPTPVAPELTGSELEVLGHGFIGSTAQVASTSGAEKDYFFLHQFDWSQGTSDRRFTMRGQLQDVVSPGAPSFNFNTASLQWDTPNATYNLLDFVLTLNGGFGSRVTPYSPINTYAIRGTDMQLKRGDNQYELFAGATLPSLYLNLSGTRDILGFNFNRKQSDKLYLYATTAGTSVPMVFNGNSSGRERGLFQTAGFSYHGDLGHSNPVPAGQSVGLDDHWAIQATVGASSRGLFGQGTITFSANLFSAFATGTRSSADFPLNQLQVLFGGGNSLQAGASFKVTPRILTGLSFQHTSSQPTAFVPGQGTSDYLSPNVNFALNRANALSFNYVYSDSRGGLTLDGQSTGHRFDIGLNSRLPRQMVNSAQVSLGAVSDPFQLNASNQLSLRDNLSVPIRGGSLSVGFYHSRLNPSLVSRLNQEIGLLSPALQQVFLANPLAFVDSPSMPPELRQLLDSLQPVNTQLSVSAQFRVGKRWNISPNFSYVRSANSTIAKTNNNAVGFNLTYQMSPTLQLESSLSNNLLFDSRQGGFARSTIFTFGMRKVLNGGPRWLMPSVRKHRIEGRVFRDMNVNGRSDDGEPGLGGILVQLDTGQTALTDASGHFEFKGLETGHYQVSLPLKQFHEPTRMTTSTDRSINVYDERVGNVDFGIVNFSRLMGSVFNDYRNDKLRQADSPSLQSVTLVVTGHGTQQKAVTDGAGDFEIDDLAPGKYEIAIDATTIPANYVSEKGPANFEVKPTATVVIDMPLRALRSIAGGVYLKLDNQGGQGSNGNTLKVPSLGAAGAGPKLIPLAGVKITADHAEVTTDANGRFVLRDLPTGDVVVTIVPVKPMPPELHLPAATVRLPMESIQINDAEIVITNTQLLPYLTATPPDI
jgi:hypothetical protein